MDSSTHPAIDPLEPLFERLPLDHAMTELLPSRPAEVDIADIVSSLPDPMLRAAAWLYVDDLDRSHTISQGIETPEGSFWHGIMHRREGDFWNSKYWFRRAGSLPARLGLDPSALTDRVERVARGENPSELVEAQRQEWLALYRHCLEQVR